MPLSAGTRLAHYDVTALLGEGGMGQVWQATDTQLNREVALKILPDAFAADPDRLARFTREAQILASLNHPNIAAIYGIEEAEGMRALVLELVEGPTLADRISKGPIPLDEALPIAKQIAEALEAAHERGVIHRDLKPANIKVRDDGTVKVLDFGLAKALDPAPDVDPSQSPTLTAAATQMGVIMGTAAYMSPEQARGKTVDKRADIWAFGAVLFEMLTGAKPFPGDDVSQTLARVIDRDPDWSYLPQTLPAGLVTYLRRCLQKEPRQRIQAIGDVRLAMEGVFETHSVSVGVGVTQPRSRRRLLSLIGTAAIVSAAVAGIAVWTVTSNPEPTFERRMVQFTIPAGIVERYGSRTHSLAVSPTGAYVVHRRALASSEARLAVRHLHELFATPLEGIGDQIGSPFVSPDGSRIGFVDESVAALQSVSLLGGVPQTICNLSERGVLRGASWGEDDVVVFGTGEPSGLWRVSASGGEPELLTNIEPERDGVNHVWPQVLPGRRGVLFTIFSGSIDEAQIAVLDLATGAHHALGRGSYPRYAESGHVVYAVGGTVRAMPFDIDTLQIVGDSIVMLDEVFTNTAGAALFDLGRGGTLVYGRTDLSAYPQTTLVWVDRNGREEPVGAPIRIYGDPDLSPEGTRVALTVREPPYSNIWIWDFTRRNLTPVTRDGSDESSLWASNGADVVFQSSRGGGGVFRRAANGTGEIETLLESPNLLTPWTWTADDRLVFVETGPGGRDIGMLNAGGESERLLADEFSEQRPAVSPDGRWIAYQSNESGQLEVYVRPFPNVDDDKMLVSTDGGEHPLWSADGRELFYRGGGYLLAVPLGADPVLSAGTPERLFWMGPYSTVDARFFDVSADGRFLMMRREDEIADGQDSPELIVVLNWFEELKRLVPTN